MKIIKINEYIGIVGFVSNEDFHQYLYSRMNHDISFYKIKKLFKIGLSKIDSLSINNINDAAKSYGDLTTNELISLYGFDTKFYSPDHDIQIRIPSLYFAERCAMLMRNKIGCDHTYSSSNGGCYYYINRDFKERIKIALSCLTSEQRRKYNFRLIINYPYLNLVKRRKRYFKSLIKTKKNACKDQSSAERLFYRILQYTRGFLKKT